MYNHSNIVKAAATAGTVQPYMHKLLVLQLSVQQHSSFTIIYSSIAFAMIIIDR